MLKVGDYIYGRRAFNGDIALGVITYVDSGSRPYFMEVLNRDNHYQLIEYFSGYPLPEGTFSKRGYWVDRDEAEYWKPKPGDYVTITQGEDWEDERDQYIGKTLKISETWGEDVEDTYFVPTESTKSIDSDFYWNLYKKHYRPATQEEIDHVSVTVDEPKPDKPLPFPKEGKVKGTIQELEKVMAYLRSTGRKFNNVSHITGDNSYYKGFSCIAWNENMLWPVIDYDRSQKPEVSYKDFELCSSVNQVCLDIPDRLLSMILTESSLQEIHSKCRIKSVGEFYDRGSILNVLVNNTLFSENSKNLYGYWETTMDSYKKKVSLIVPDGFSTFRKFLTDRGGNRLFNEYVSLTKSQDLSKIPLANLIFSGITWDKSIAFVDWSLINQDWKKFVRESNEKLKKLDEKAKQSTAEVIKDCKETVKEVSGVDFDIDVAGNTRTIHVDTETQQIGECDLSLKRSLMSACTIQAYEKNLEAYSKQLEELVSKTYVGNLNSLYNHQATSINDTWMKPPKTSESPEDVLKKLQEIKLTFIKNKS